MEPRIDYLETAPDVAAAMMGLREYVHQAELEQQIVGLVNLRASILNGAAYCADRHTNRPVAR